MRRLIAPLLATSLSWGLWSAEPVKPVVDPNRPEAAILIPVQLLRSNDFRGFYEAMPPAEQAKARAEWAKGAGEAKSDKVDELNALLAKLLAPNAVETLMAEATPKLKEVNPQEISQGLQMVGMMLMMAQMQPPKDGQKPDPTSKAVMAAVSGMLTDASQWVLTAGIEDPVKCRKAIERLVAGAKALGVKDVRELQALPLDEVLGRLSPLVKEAKAAAAVYDVQIDAFLASVTATAGTVAGDTATIQVGFTAFAKPYRIPVEVVRKDGHWVINPKNGKQLGSMLPMGGAGQDEDIAPAPMPQPKRQASPAAPVTP